MSARKSLVFLAVLAAACVFVRVHASAQAPEQQDPVNALQDRIGRLEERINGLEAQQEKAQREIMARLDQVLANQERIFRELEIVKVRATLRP